MSSWMSASSSPNRNSASALASSVLPTPVGPAKMNEPPGRFGSFRPPRVRGVASEMHLSSSAGARSPDGLGDRPDRLVLADHALVQLIFHVEQARGLFLGHLEYRDAGRV